MKVHCIAGLLLTFASVIDAAASECRLTVAGETIEFPHVAAHAAPNHFDKSRDNIVVRCFREEIPADNQSASEIIWFSPDSGRIVIELSPDDKVTSVDVKSGEFLGNISGMNFAVEFDGARDGNQLTGKVKTTENLKTLVNGEYGDPWRVSADLDIEVVKD